MRRSDGLSRGAIARKFSIRAMTLDDVPAGLRLCRASGWNQVEADWWIFLRFSPNGCRVAEKCGDVVGSVATIRYGDSFSWLSMLLVDPRERGNGLGTELLQQGLAILSEERCCRLDATPAGRRIYSKNLFVEEYSLSRMRGVVDAKRFGSNSTASRPMRESDLIEIADCDFRVFGADRAELLAQLYWRAPEYARVLEENGRISAYILGRPGFLYDQLGPVVAQNEDGARSLVSDCLGAHPGKRFAIDAPRSAWCWLQWLQAMGFAEERVFVRMYRGDNPHSESPDRQFAVVGPEFG